jgi:osmotically inducible protein OsmC
MAIRTANTAWKGTLTEGSGQTELTSSGVATLSVSWPKRISDEADGTTSPEELVAAAHASCYAMQFSALIERAGGTPVALDVRSDVSFGPDPAGGFHIGSVKLTVSGQVEGMDAETFAKTAEDAKATCPISKALAAVGDITLDATLEK